jgi:hypothetical protein
VILFRNELHSRLNIGNVKFEISSLFIAVMCLTFLLSHVRAGDGYLLSPKYVNAFKLSVKYVFVCQSGC